jgi:hypothetical protein
LSIALQYGARIADIAKSFGELRDEGASNGPPASPLGTIARRARKLKPNSRRRHRMIEFHPLANLFPLIEGDEFDHLVEDIRANGLRDQIVLLGGQVLDGRNRYRAGMLAERVDADDITSANFREFDPEQDGEPLAFVLSKNLARRHLNESQRAMVAARIANMPGHRPGDKSANLQTSQPSDARQMNVSTRSSWRPQAGPGQGHRCPQARGGCGESCLRRLAAQACKAAAAQQDEIAKQAEAGKANVVRTVIKQAAAMRGRWRWAQSSRRSPTKSTGSF